MGRSKYIFLNVMFAVYYLVFAVSPLEYANAMEPASAITAQAAKVKSAKLNLFVVDLVLSNFCHHDDAGKARVLFQKRRASEKSRFETSKARMVLPRAIPRALPPNGFVGDDPQRTAVIEDLPEQPEAPYIYAAEEPKPKAERGYKQDHSGLSPPIA